MSGKLFWKSKTSKLVMSGSRDAKHSAANWNGRFAGKEAFVCLSDTGYLKGRFLGREMYAHRVIWKIFYGVEPDTIDHINGDRTDNRIANLRSISPSENNKNMGKSKRNTSGVVGVSRTPAGKWSANIVNGGKSIWLGTFCLKRQAVAARQEAERHLGFMPTTRRGCL